MTVVSQLVNGGSGLDYRDTLNDMLTRMLPNSIAQTMRAQGLDATVFEAIPFLGLTAPSEYVDFIAMIDTLVGITDGAVTKSAIGTASDNASLLYSYVTGNPAPNARAVLLLAGQHSVEPVGQLAAIRTFAWLARSTHPVARRLRTSYKVVLVPNANPWAFKQTGGGRVNFNGVNLNRNWPFFWSIYDNAGNTGNAKGASAASENETQRIIALFNTYNFVLAIDNHNMGANEMTTDLQVGVPSPWVHGNRTVVDAATAAWIGATSTLVDPADGTVKGGTVGQFGVDFDGEPLFHSWASYFMTVVKGNRFATSAVIESNSNLAGGTERVLTDRGATLFCNMHVNLMRAQLEQGTRADVARPYRTFMLRANTDAATSVTAGGTLVDNTAAAPIQFDSIYSINLAGGKRAFRDVPTPTAGLIKVTATGYLESSGTTEQRVDLAFVANGTQSGNYLTSVTVPATSGLRVPFTLTGYIQVTAVPDAAALQRVAVNIFKSGTNTANNPKIIRAYADIEFTPNSGTSPIPSTPALSA